MTEAKRNDGRGRAPIWRQAFDLSGQGFALVLGLGGCAVTVPESGAQEQSTGMQGAPADYAQTTTAPSATPTAPAAPAAPTSPYPEAPAQPYPSAAATSPEEVEAAIALHLERLDQLAIVDVAGLVMSLPDEAAACYGGPPCPRHESEYERERARQEPRLSALAEIAERVAADGSLVSDPYVSEGQALDALRALRIVEVNALIVSAPENNPLCYSLPCPEDVARANAENGLRVSQAFEIATQAQIEEL